MPDRGFTLLELVLVMVLLGALAAFSSAFLGQGAKVYVDAVARDRLMSEVRFGLERLNRELRDAVPGSVTLSSNGSCVQFWPIKAAARYVSAPISSSVSTLTQLQPLLGNPAVGDYALVYPLGLDISQQQCSSSTCVLAVSAISAVSSGSAMVQTVSLQPLSGSYNGFGAASPGQRVYYANQQVQYCQQGSLLVRSERSLASTTTTSATMAAHLQRLTFSVPAATTAAQGMVRAELVVAQGDDVLNLSHLVEVANVP